MNEDEVSSLISGMMFLIENNHVEFNDAQRYRFQASKLDIKFIQYKDQSQKTLTFYKSTSKLCKCVDDLFEIFEVDKKWENKQQTEVFYEAISLLISVCSDPPKYGFVNVDSDFEKVKKYNDEVLNLVLVHDLSVDTYNYMTELIEYCPQIMYQHASNWYQKVSCFCAQTHNF